jgi:hypothetical protein
MQGIYQLAEVKISILYGGIGYIYWTEVDNQWSAVGMHFLLTEIYILVQ